MTREDLRRIPYAEEKVRGAREELERFEAVICAPVAPILKKERTQNSKEEERLSELLAIHVDLKRRWIEAVKEYIDARRRFSDALELLTSDERAVLKLRYLQRLSWEEIAAAMCYSNSSVRRFEAAAVLKISNI